MGVDMSSAAATIVASGALVSALSFGALVQWGRKRHADQDVITDLAPAVAERPEDETFKEQAVVATMLRGVTSEMVKSLTLQISDLEGEVSRLRDQHRDSAG